MRVQSQYSIDTDQREKLTLEPTRSGKMRLRQNRAHDQLHALFRRGSPRYTCAQIRGNRCEDGVRLHTIKFLHGYTGVMIRHLYSLADDNSCFWSHKALILLWCLAEKPKPAQAFLRSTFFRFTTRLPYPILPTQHGLASTVPCRHEASTHPSYFDAKYNRYATRDGLPEADAIHTERFHGRHRGR